MLNRLTPSNTQAAAKEIVHGVRVSTDWALDNPKFPGFGRAKFEHKIIAKTPRTVNDDEVKLNTQSSSQWDGFRHYGELDVASEEKLKLMNDRISRSQGVLQWLYDGRRAFLQPDWNTWYTPKPPDSLNILTVVQVWVENGGVVGRGVLLDYKTWAESQGRKSAPLETTEITTSDLDAIAASQGVTFQPGDILFIHSGYVRAFEALAGEEAKSYVANPPPKAIGVKSGAEMLRWLWEKEFAAVAGDMLAFEALPFQSTDYSLHEWLLAGWGLPIGELFDLEQLAGECKRLKKWSFFFSSVPLKVPGGVASPPNGVAIL